MYKLALMTISLFSLTACIAGMAGENVTRNYTGPTSCDNFQGISATYINNNSAGLPLRCGPQSVSPYSR